MVSKITSNGIMYRVHVILFIVLFSSLMKDYAGRPNYNQLLELNFITEHAEKDTNVAEFVGEILDLPDVEQSV